MNFNINKKILIFFIIISGLTNIGCNSFKDNKYFIHSNNSNKSIVNYNYINKLNGFKSKLTTVAIGFLVANSNYCANSEPFQKNINFLDINDENLASFLIIDSIPNNDIYLSGDVSNDSFNGIFLHKSDPNGNRIWTKIIPELYSGQNNVIQLNDLDIVLAANGGSVSTGGNTLSIHLFKFDSSGTNTWTKILSDNQTSPNSIRDTNDGGFIMSANIAKDLNNRKTLIKKYDSNVIEQWTSVIDSAITISCDKIIQTSDNGYAIYGEVDRQVFTLIKLDESGNLDWYRFFGKANSGSLYGIVEDQSSNILLSGSTNDFGMSDDTAWILKFDSVGSLQWAKIYPSEISSASLSFDRTQDGGFISYGYVVSPLGILNSLMIKIDNNGSIVWTENLALEGFSSLGYATKEDLNQDILFSGFAVNPFSGNSDIYFGKISSLGDASNCTNNTLIEELDITSLINFTTIDLNFTSVYELTVTDIFDQIFIDSEVNETIGCIFTNSPTSSPSLAPTNAPSFSPTTPPTFSPSLSPTTLPSNSPSIAPTNIPSYSPTIPPTNFPTFSPTFSPTANPTISPTNVPTDSPTFSPTFSPTANPTGPTENPTNAPTQPPTFSPTGSPSQPPTLAPSNSPTFPTINPTNAPTESPSLSPTDAPTESNDLTAAEITAISIGGVVFIILLILLVACLIGRLKKLLSQHSLELALYQTNNTIK